MSSQRLPLSSRQTFMPDEIARREFSRGVGGYDRNEVRTFLSQVSEQFADLSDRVAEIQRALADSEERAKNPELTEEMVTALLGQQTAQILRSAREAANDIRSKAEEEVGRDLREAHEVTSRMKQEAETLLAERTDEAERMAQLVKSEAAEEAENTRRQANEEASRLRTEVADDAARQRADLDAEIMRNREQARREIDADLTSSRQQGRDLVDAARAEATSLVERTQERQAELIEGLVRKRKIAIAQVEELRAGRQRLLKAYKMVRSTLDEVTNELQRVEDEARQAATVAGHRAIAAAELQAEDLDTVIEIEQFSLRDDVPAEIIDLISEDGETFARPDSFSAHNVDTPFDQEEGGIFGAGSAGGPREDLDMSAGFGGFGSGGSATAGAVATQPSFTPMSMSTSTSAKDEISVIDDYEDDDYYEDDDEEVDITSESQTQTQAPVTKSFIIGESYTSSESAGIDHALQLRRDAVVGKARSQATRRLKRALQDEQDALVSRLSSGDGHSVQALLGSIDDQASTYQRAVLKLFREVARTGASSVEGSRGVERGTIDQTGTTAARGMAGELVEDLRGELQPLIEALLEEADMPQGAELQARISGPYEAIMGAYLDRLVDDRIGGVFDQGAAFARG